MTLIELLDALAARCLSAPADANLDLLLERARAGLELVECYAHVAGIGGLPAPVIAFRGRRSDGPDEWIPVSVGPRARSLLRARFGRLDVAADDGLAVDRAGSAARDLLRVLDETSGLPARERAETLADWILERIDGSRCAIVPVDAEVFSPMHVFRLRGGAERAADPRHLPRAVLSRVARTRQPLINHDAGAVAQDLLPTDTVVRQRIRSYMAIPVVFRDELLAVAYLDRLREASSFSREDQAAFQAFAYELARPLLALRHAERQREFAALRDTLLAPASELPRSPALDEVVGRARTLAPLRGENLLVLGETGVGKEWLARLVHAWSGRKGAFVAVNVAGIPRELFESELMGTARGAYTGATDRAGLAVSAEGGTLFLDEIGDLDLAGQVQLLRFVQEKTVRPVGGRAERPVDVRVIAATNRDVRDLVRRGTFRADLLHRFAPPLVVPPLRQRREEIVPLATACLEALARGRGVAAAKLAPDATDLLLAHAWPGNVRELQAILSHASALASGGVIESEQIEALLSDAAIPPDVGGEAAPRTWAEHEAAQDAREKRWLEATLAAHGGNAEAMSRTLAVPSTTLRRVLKRHRLVEGR